MLHLPGSIGTYQGEDIWSFECDIVESFAIFLSFGVARNNVFGNALEFLECKAYTALVGTYSLFASKDPNSGVHTFSSLKFFYLSDLEQ